MKTTKKTAWKPGYAWVGMLLFTACLSTEVMAAGQPGSDHHRDRRTTGSLSSVHQRDHYRADGRWSDHERKHHRHDNRYTGYRHHAHKPARYPVRVVPHFHPYHQSVLIAPEPRTSPRIRVWIQLPWLLLQ